MATIQDTPVDHPDAGMQDTPVTEPILPSKAPLADDLNNVTTFQAAVVKSNNDGTPLFDAFQAIDGNVDSQNELKQQAQIKANKDAQDFQQAYVQNPGATPEEAKQNFEATQHLVGSLNQQVQNPDLAYVKTLTKGQVDPSVEADLASQLSLAKIMKQTWDNMSKGEVAGDVLKMMIPGNMAYGNYSLTGHVSAEEYLKNLVLNYKAMTPQQQVAVQPKIVKELSDGLGNKLKVMTVLNAMLAPGGESDLNQFGKLWAAIDVGTAATMGATLGTKVFRLTKALNAVRIAAADSNTAADVAASATVAENIAQKANIDHATTAADIASGINAGGDVAYQGNLSTPVLQRLEKFRNQVKSVADQLKSGDIYLQEGLLQQQERDTHELNAVQQLYQDPAIENVRITNRTPVSTEFTYDSVDSEGNVVPGKYKLDLTLNDVGAYDQNHIGVVSRFAASPDVWAKGNLRDSAKAATRLDSANAIVLNQLTQLQRAAVKDVLGPLGLKGLTPSGRRRLAALDEVLRVGDEQQKVFTPLELQAGVNGVPLDDKQIEAYYKIRSLVDSLHYMRNFTKREELALKGMKNINIDDATQAVGRPLNEFKDAQASTRLTNAHYMYDAENRTMSPIPREPSAPDVPTGHATMTPEELQAIAVEQPRGGDEAISKLADSIKQNGITRPAIVIRNEDGSMELANGHHLSAAAKQAGYENVPVRIIDAKSVGGDLNAAAEAADAANFTFAKAYRESTYKNPLEVAYQKGYKLVRLNEPTAFINSEGQPTDRVYYALVKADSVTDLPEVVLPYRTGYIPKINDEASYFVKEYSATRLDGQAIPKTDARANIATIRAFDNRKDAEEFAAQMQEKNPDKMYRALEDRQIEKERRAVGGGGPNGGLYTGARAEEDIPFGKDGLPPQRIGSFEAISRNLANLSRYIPRNTWRIGNEQRALNTAKRLIPQGRWESFNDLSLAPDTEAGRFLRKLHDQLEAWMGVPTKEEQLWSAMVQSVYDHIGTSKFMPGIAKKSLQYLRHKDPIAAGRAAAFHSLLGWFNPVQLWVQAQGASVALSANILDLPEMANVLRLQQALSAVDHMDSVKGIALVAKGFGMSPEELTVLKAAWRKSGLRDAILTTSDYAAAAHGRGVAMDAIKRASDKGLFFYRIGELFNRRVSFITAYREWKKAHQVAALNDEALKWILSRSNDYMLNLTKANQAFWQRGILSLPTQFLQVSTKAMESVLGVNGNFTAAERGKILLSQFLLYGAAGIPLGAMGVNWLAQELGVTQSDLENNPKYTNIRKLVNEGFTGWGTMALFGVDVDIGQRSSLANGINQTLDNLLFADSNVSQMFLGAFGTTATRFWDGWLNLWEPLSLGQAEVTKLDAYNAVALAFSPISTFRDTSKAIFMHNFNRIITKNGRTMVHRDFTLREEVAQAIGFRLTDEVQVRQLQDIVKAKKDYESDVANAIVNVYWDYAKAIREGLLDDTTKKNTRQKIALMLQSVDNPYERNLIRQRVQDILTNGTDQKSAVWQQVRKLWNDGQVDYLTGWHNKLRADGLLQENPIYPGAENNQSNPANGAENTQQPSPATPKTFVSSYQDQAKKAAAQLGVDPDILLAQAALETGWGKHAPGNNFFGIKGEGQTLQTQEVVNGKTQTVNANFKGYENAAQSFQSYVDHIKNDPRYAQALAMAHDPEEYVKALQEAGYATDPNYAKKIMSIYKRIKSGE